MAFPTFGQLQLDTHGIKPRPNVERSEMETGPAKQRRISSRDMHDRPMVYHYTEAEFTAFEAWYWGDVGGGMEWDDWEDPRDGQTKLARLVAAEYEAKPFVEYDGGPLKWEVSFLIETWGN